MNKIYALNLSWSISRGRDTYGYNICRLDCDGKRWRTIGGGYDMIGTVVGNYFADEHQSALLQLVHDHKNDLVDCGYSVKGYQKLPGFYGLTVNPQGEIQLDGACGINSMENIIRACGFELEYSVNRKGNVTGYCLQKEAA